MLIRELGNSGCLIYLSGQNASYIRFCQLSCCFTAVNNSLSREDPDPGASFQASCDQPMISVTTQGCNNKTSF
ncbi:uncharacterized protein Dvir_GJ26291 [Drosophila virilis]|uniref:Uncharacterized protein n=1 Tax=Drosophila virilis TaxID=7244 RepID=A0A0Q9WNY2_DROVI|nr:uncharacterized protein Dvir_GJ26291 [Drosophila virilis]